MRKKPDPPGRARRPAGPREAQTAKTMRSGPGRRSSLTLVNRHPGRKVNLPALRRIAQALLREMWPGCRFDLGIYMVAAAEMARLNETFLQHSGSTDVITFDYAQSPGAGAQPGPPPALLHGEILVCLDEAISQARRFRTTWQSELIRYVVHGVLHLRGYDDRSHRLRQQMKKAEDGLVRRLAGRFDFGALG